MTLLGVFNQKGSGGASTGIVDPLGMNGGSYHAIDIEFTPASASSELWVKLNADGTYTIDRVVDERVVLSAGPLVDTNVLTPSEVEVRLTVLSGDALDYNSASTFVSLASARSGGLVAVVDSNMVMGGFEEKSSSVQLEVREIANPSNIVTATFNLYVNASVEQA